MVENQRRNRVRRFFNGLSLDIWQLKMIAATAMLCSHIYKCLLVGQKEFLFLDVIGRISFPIFCFVLVEGFCHTRNKKRYLLRLWTGAVFSELPFNLAFYGTLSAPAGQNVLFTMLIGMLTLLGVEKCRGFARYPVIAAGMAAAWLLKVDYGWYGIWLIVMFYLFRGMKQELTKIQAGSYVLSVACYHWIQIFSVLSIPVLACYRGEKGKNRKYLFYLFYPLHLLVLVLIRIYL